MGIGLVLDSVGAGGVWDSFFFFPILYLMAKNCRYSVIIDVDSFHKV